MFKKKFSLTAIIVVVA